MSISTGLLRGMQMWQMVQNVNLQERRMKIFEAQEARQQAAFDYRQQGGGHERDFKLIDAYQQDESQYGENTAFSALVASYDGDFEALMQDPEASQLAFKYMKQGDTEISRRLGSNKGWEGAGIVNNNDGTFTIRLRNKEEGRDADLTDGRIAQGKGGRSVKQTTDQVTGGIVAAGAEKGAFNDPYLGVVAQSYGATPEVLTEIAKESTESISYAPNFDGVRKRVAQNRSFGKVPEVLNDIIVDDQVGLGQLVEGYTESDKQKQFNTARQIEEYYKDDRNWENTSKLGEDTDKAIEAVKGAFASSKKFVEDNTSLDELGSAFDVDRALEVGKNAASSMKEGIIDGADFISKSYEEAVKTKQESGIKGVLDKRVEQLSNAVDRNQEFIDEKVDSLKEKAGKIVDTIGEWWYGEKRYKSIKEADTQAGKDLVSNDPQTVENAGKNITKSINGMTPEQRVETAHRDLEYTFRIGEKRKSSGKPKPSARAAAARLYANGMLPQQAYANYLENGKFSYDDIEAAARLNTSRANMIRAKTAQAKAIKDFGADWVKEREPTYKARLNATKAYVEQSLTTRGSSANVKYMSEMLEAIHRNKQIIGALGINHPYELTDEHMKVLSDWFIEKEVPRLKKNDKSFFWGSDAYTPNVNVEGFTRYLQEKK